MYNVHFLALAPQNLIFNETLLEKIEGLLAVRSLEKHLNFIDIF